MDLDSLWTDVEIVVSASAVISGTFWRIYFLSKREGYFERKAKNTSKDKSRKIGFYEGLEKN